MDYEEYKSQIRERSKALYHPDSRSMRRWYQHDIDVIVYSDMFRKMQRKSQLLSINDPISRSRLIHTFEVVRIAKEISEKLGLDSELTEAIALAHDFGNVAYGKQADFFLEEKTNGLFKHEEIGALMLKVFSARLIPDKYRDKAVAVCKKSQNEVKRIEIDEFPYFLEVFNYNQDYYYSCMSPEVIDGVIKHGTSNIALTLEGQVVNYADNIAYLVQDISDFEVTGIFKKSDCERYSRCLDEITSHDDDEEYPLSGIVGKTTSVRTSTLIERYVSYNENLLKNGKYSRIRSDIFKDEIPVLKIPHLLQEALDLCWKFKDEFYQNNLIKVSNMESEARISQIWNILEESSLFCENNKSFSQFKKLLNSPIYASYKKEKMNFLKEMWDENIWKQWEKACFIAHLTCDEIDLIINSFLERDYSFDLSLPTIG